jgi:hypothetical protein
MARPPPLPLQHEVAAAVRGARQGGAEVARIKIRKSAAGDGEFEIETTLAPALPPEPAEGEWDEFARAAAEKMRKV